MMKVGEVSLPTDEDFQHFKNECTSYEGWTICYEKSGCQASTKKNSLSTLDVVRIRSDFPDTSAELLYDVLHDGQYRLTWDSTMLEGYEICYVSPNSDIGYFLGKSPIPFQNRDLVKQRYWLDRGPNQEKYIISHSVNHLREPERKNVVRAISYLTGYLIIPTGPSSCTFYYMTQGDPGGYIPAWITNYVMKAVAPTMIKKLVKACREYEEWKSKNEPSHKPWLYPEQRTAPHLNPADIGQFDVPKTLKASSNSDEEAIRENAVDIDYLVKDD